MKESWRLHVLIVAVLAVMIGFAVPAMAQEAEEEPGETPDTPETAVEAEKAFVEEIVVTARRREETLQEVPVAVSVVAGAQLEDVAASNISELEKYVPNVNIFQGRNQSTTLTAFIRGVGQSDPLWGVDPGVGLYIDDVYIARAQGALLDVYDVQRVEVLRGPQGTLYGKNTIGGAIKYVTRPLTDEWMGKITWNPGTFNTQEIRASAGGALVQGKLRAKGAFAKLTRDGYGDNLYQNREVSNRDSTAYRLALEWLPTDNLSIRGDFDRTEDNAEPVGLTRLADSALCYAFLGQGCPPYDNLFDTESGIDPVNDVTTTGYSLTLTWDINDALRFKSITATRETDTRNWIDFDTTPAAIADSEATYYDDQTTQEFQLVYDGGGKLSGVVGLYYFDGTAGGVVEAIFFTNFPNSTTGETKTKSYALYADAAIQLTDRLSLNLGIRPTRETKEGSAFNVFNIPPDDFSAYYFVAGEFDEEATFTSWAPKLGLDYQFSDNVMGYFKVNRGFKSGGFNVRAQNNIYPVRDVIVDDEVMTVGEIGVKSMLANNSLLLNTAIFYGDYTDIQVSTFTAYDADGDGVDDAFFGDFLNAGDATIKGAELEYNWASAAFFGLSGFLAYLDATPDTFLDENEDEVLDTQVITNAPKWTGSLRGNFNWPGFGGEFSASVGYSYRDEATLTNEGVDPFVQDAFGLVDAWITWVSPQAHWRLGVSGKNLTDEEYLTSGYNIPALGIYHGSYGMPRTFVATLEYNFF